jgi:hypothetical protein
MKYLFVICVLGQDVLTHETQAYCSNMSREKCERSRVNFDLLGEMPTWKTKCVERRELPIDLDDFQDDSNDGEGLRG